MLRGMFSFVIILLLSRFVLYLAGLAGILGNLVLFFIASAMSSNISLISFSLDIVVNSYTAILQYQSKMDTTHKKGLLVETKMPITSKEFIYKQRSLLSKTNN